VRSLLGAPWTIALSVDLKNQITPPDANAAAQIAAEEAIHHVARLAWEVLLLDSAVITACAALLFGLASLIWAIRRKP
jgi:hypothetical protein